MAATMIVKHRVANYDAWAKVFESMNDLRRNFGWTSHLVLRDATDPNVITVVGRIRSLDGAKGYGASTEMREAMKLAGVQGPPDVSFTEDAVDYTY